jgi:nitrite reductase/ring-hydroxylating ferredoxin subunit
VRTGEVTQGPAKVDLRTYKVEVRDNEIYVRVPRQVYEEQAHEVIV